MKVKNFRGPWKRNALVLAFLAACTVSGGSAFVACKKRSFNPQNAAVRSDQAGRGTEEFALGLTPEEETLLSSNSLQVKFARCAAELGSLPDFSCGENDLDGTDRVVPRVVDKPYTRDVEHFIGHVGNAERPFEITQAEGDCENPAQLRGGTHCYPHSRIGTLPSFDRNGTLMPHVQAGFICRRGGRTTVQSKAPFLGYHDIAVVQTDTKTGRTCYYQYLRMSTEEKNPSPFKWDSLKKLKSSDAAEVQVGKSEIAAGSRFFVAGGSQCTRCHDSDPIIHTRHTEAVLENGQEVGRPILPKFAWGLKSNFSLVTSPTDKVSSHVFVNKDETVRDGRETCTSCHKIGVNNTCRKLVDPQTLPQWFGNFLEDHKRIEKSKLDAGLEAIQACCKLAQNSPTNRDADPGRTYDVTTASGKQIKCTTQELPFR